MNLFLFLLPRADRVVGGGCAEPARAGGRRAGHHPCRRDFAQSSGLAVFDRRRSKKLYPARAKRRSGCASRFEQTGYWPALQHSRRTCRAHHGLQTAVQRLFEVLSPGGEKRAVLALCPRYTSLCVDPNVEVDMATTLHRGCSGTSERSRLRHRHGAHHSTDGYYAEDDNAPVGKLKSRSENMKSPPCVATSGAMGAMPVVFGRELRQK